MSNLSDFFPAPVSSSPWGPSGDPDYLVSLLMWGGGSGRSLQPAFAGGAGGGFFISDNCTAIYAGVPVPVTVGSGGANAGPTGAGTPAGMASPGSPSTFGCITAYGGGAPGTTSGPCCISGCPGGVGGLFGVWDPFVSCNCGFATTQLTLSGASYNFANKFGIHRGYWCSNGANCDAIQIWGGIRGRGNDGSDPRYPVPGTPIVPGFYCLDISLGTRAILGTPSPLYQSTFGTVGATRCYSDCFYPPNAIYPGAAGTATGGTCTCSAGSGTIWVVYPCAYPAATAPGAIDCTPCVKTGYRAYRFTSPGSFTLS